MSPSQPFASAMSALQIHASIMTCKNAGRQISTCDSAASVASSSFSESRSRINRKSWIITAHLVGINLFGKSLAGIKARRTELWHHSVGRRPAFPPSSQSVGPSSLPNASPGNIPAVKFWNVFFDLYLQQDLRLSLSTMKRSSGITSRFLISAQWCCERFSSEYFTRSFSGNLRCLEVYIAFCAVYFTVWVELACVIPALKCVFSWYQCAFMCVCVCGC